MVTAQVELSLSDLLAGDHDLGTSRWMLITQHHIDLFAAATGDHQWIHTDRERAARETRLGTTIVHGMLIVSVVPAAIQRMLRIRDADQRLNYGVDRVRFLEPVAAGSEVRVKARISDARRRGKSVLYRISAEIELQSATRPAAVAELLSLAVPLEAS